MSQTLTHCGFSSAEQVTAGLARLGIRAVKTKRPNAAPPDERKEVRDLLDRGYRYKQIRELTGKSFGFINKVKFSKPE